MIVAQVSLLRISNSNKYFNEVVIYVEYYKYFNYTIFFKLYLEIISRMQIKFMDYYGYIKISEKSYPSILGAIINHL